MAPAEQSASLHEGCSTQQRSTATHEVYELSGSRLVEGGGADTVEGVGTGVGEPFSFARYRRLPATASPRTRSAVAAVPSSDSGLTYVDEPVGGATQTSTFALQGRAKRASDESARNPIGASLPSNSLDARVTAASPAQQRTSLRTTGLPPSAFSLPHELGASPRRVSSNATAAPLRSPAAHKELSGFRPAKLARRPAAPFLDADAASDVLAGALDEDETQLKENRPELLLPRRSRSRVEEWRDEVLAASAARSSSSSARAGAEAKGNADLVLRSPSKASGLQQDEHESDEATSTQQKPRRRTPAAAKKRAAAGEAVGHASLPKRRSTRKKSSRRRQDESFGAADQTGVSTADLVAMLPKRAKVFGKTRENEEESDETDYEYPSRKKTKSKPRARAVAQSKGGGKSPKRTRKARDQDTSDDTDTQLRKEQARRKWAEVDSFALEVERTL
ncbi:hypothetical protein Rhopal_005134-T1 [Rhodotorula paludigena]|uniref:Proteophosphoglycan ppg4 n=1 Tax=Rhodotorula paludigena TaxID=86838 RepID=A0AAV5GHK0_9BASI|nr:hypothetical protein Rhopal_005134-T1 [Rhodotorula paludigena]